MKVLTIAAAIIAIELAPVAAVVIDATPAHAQVDNQDTWDWVKQHCTQATPCYNGQIPSYDNPDCWPGAIYCSPPGTPPDTTATARRYHDDNDCDQDGCDEETGHHGGGGSNGGHHSHHKHKEV